MSLIERHIPPDGAIHVGQHIVGIYSKASSGNGRITTTGMSKFGLPDIEASDVPEALAKFDVVVKGVGQYLVDELMSSTEQGANRLAVRSEVVLTIQKVAKALAGYADDPTASNSALIRLELGPSLFYRDAEDMIHVLPPRSESNTARWIAETVDNLFGLDAN
jgi:hypothetical protein